MFRSGRARLGVCYGPSPQESGRHLVPSPRVRPYPGARDDSRPPRPAALAKYPH
jgi:hypothetical protein